MSLLKSIQHLETENRRLSKELINKQAIIADLRYELDETKKNLGDASTELLLVQEENADILLDNVEKDIRLCAIEQDMADLMLELAFMQDI